MNCSACPSYKRGRGSQACLTCDKYEDVLPKYKPPPPTASIPYIVLEEAAMPERLRSSFEALRHIDDESATMILQSLLLGMKHQEIAEYHNKLYSRSSISRKISNGLHQVKKILHNDNK